MIICADDFGIAADVDQSILNLAAERKISAVSVMAALLPGPTPALQSLLQQRSNLDIGLHLVLTAPAVPTGAAGADTLCTKGRFLSLAALLQRSMLRRVSARDARRHIAAQYQRFVELCGCAPAFVDGHLHVHQFPGIREGLLEFVIHLPPETRPYIRNAYEPLPGILRRGVAPLKSLWIGWFGRALRQRLRQLGLRTNTGFGGICDYRRWRDYPLFLQRFIQSAQHPNSLIMVHPGLHEPWRLAEYNGLRGTTFSPNQPARFSFVNDADDPQGCR